ncbi:MAG: hypothetical protein BWX93_00966 [Bacteroidetes bacterium ADurb.Bin139]|nr:MAG: hypothetical protein BWX93_00966 [Bacteroidetes bacterium ADurb.Bin139]
MTSTVCILSVDIWRVSTPVPAVDSPTVPMADVFLTCRLASLERVTPSMITAVPKALALLEAISLMVSWLTRLSPGFSVRLPGTNCMMSRRLTGCTCSNACFSILEEELSFPPSSAVTTTSSSRRLAWAICNTSPAMSRSSFWVKVFLAYPRISTRRVCVPAGTPVKRKEPSSPEIYQSPVSSRKTVA